MENRTVAAITGQGTFTLVEEPVPELQPGQVLVEVKCSLISPGTELMGVPALRKKPMDMPPRKFGYSSAGVVIKQGPGCEDIPTGMKVACMGANYAQHSGINRIPRNMMVPIPDGVNFEQAAFAHLGATALHAVRRADLAFGEHTAVMGLGIIGQCAVQLAGYSGCHVAGFDRLSSRLDLAARLGAEEAIDIGTDNEDTIVEKVRSFTRGYGLDCAFLAFGGNFNAAAALLQKLMKKSPDTHLMGRLVVVGVGNITLEGLPISFGNMDIRLSSRPGAGYHDKAYEHGSDYPPVFMPWTCKRNMEEVLRFAAAGKLDLASLITHRLPLDGFAAGAEELVRNPADALGVIINY